MSLSDKKICRYCGCRNTKEEHCHHHGIETLYCFKEKDVAEAVEELRDRMPSNVMKVIDEIFGDLKGGSKQNGKNN